jgi:N-acetylmannosamine-6-phosphate 2-epimerase/N-acetylmannosamine kinase
MSTAHPVVNGLFRELIVSCQAPDGDPFRDPASMAQFARAAARGGAAGLRANGPDDVRAICQAVPLPVIGIHKRRQADGKILITPEFEDARRLVDAGASIVALDCTERGRRHGALERLQHIRGELRVPVMADIATIEEALAAAAAGADVVASTMRGYTPETESVRGFEPAFIRELASRLDIPVFAEGRIATPEQAAEAVRAGAFAVIVGTAITRPATISARFAGAIRAEMSMPEWIVGLDLGGTCTKFGLVSRDGELRCESTLPTSPGGGRDALLGHVKTVAARGVEIGRRAGLAVGAVGIATAGWVDAGRGRVVCATGNLPGWTGTEIASEIASATGLPVAVENDANALAMAERHFGLGRGLDHFVCLTLGTGVGGGCYIGGRLNRGAHFFANALGHISIEQRGLPCTCGLSGCLEVYAGAAALLRYAGAGFETAEQVVQAAHRGDRPACDALRTYAAHLATGIAVIVHVLDPQAVILSGGIAQGNRILLDSLEQRLAGMLIAASQRRLTVSISELGYHGGVLGAAAAVLEKRGAVSNTLREITK